MEDFNRVKRFHKKLFCGSDKILLETENELVLEDLRNKVLIKIKLDENLTKEMQKTASKITFPDGFGFILSFEDEEKNYLLQALFKQKNSEMDVYFFEIVNNSSKDVDKKLLQKKFEPVIKQFLTKVFQKNEIRLYEITGQIKITKNY